MRRAKCCCCPEGDVYVVAQSPNRTGTWDLTPYRSRNYIKYKNRWWDIRQNETVLARGKVGGDGALEGLPESVTLGTNGHNAVLRTRCSPICGDPNYSGEVIATNAGLTEPWDISFLTDEIAPEGVWGGYWTVRTVCSEGNDAPQAVSGRIDKAGEYLDVPLEPLDAHIGDRLDRQYYREVVISCNGYIGNIPPIHGGGEYQKVGAGFYPSVYTEYHDTPGKFAPGATVDFDGEGYQPKTSDDGRYRLELNPCAFGDDPTPCSILWIPHPACYSTRYCADSLGRILLPNPVVNSSGRNPSCPVDPPLNTLPYTYDFYVTINATG